MPVPADDDRPDPGAAPVVDPDVDLDVPAERAELVTPGRGPVLSAVAVGGVVGALARHGLGVAWPHPPGGWPWATFATNVSGCLAIGVLTVLIAERFRAHPLVRPLLGVGVLGGYTTFSTYQLDVVATGVAGRPLVALAYLAATPVAAVAAVALGVLGARRATGLRGPQ